MSRRGRPASFYQCGLQGVALVEPGLAVEIVQHVIDRLVMHAYERFVFWRLAHYPPIPPISQTSPHVSSAFARETPPKVHSRALAADLNVGGTRKLTTLAVDVQTTVRIARGSSSATAAR